MLRYFTRIEACRARHIATATVVPRSAAILLTEPAAFIRLPLVGLAEVEDQESEEDAATLHTIRLTAALRCRPELPEGPYVFRLTAADGSRWLMGSPRRPFATTLMKDTHPARTTEAAAVSLTATLTHTLPLLRMEG